MSVTFWITSPDDAVDPLSRVYWHVRTEIASDLAEKCGMLLVDTGVKDAQNRVVYGGTKEQMRKVIHRLTEYRLGGFRVVVSTDDEFQYLKEFLRNYPDVNIMLERAAEE